MSPVSFDDDIHKSMYLSLESRDMKQIDDQVDSTIYTEGLARKFEIIRASQVISSHKLHRKIVMTSETAAISQNPTVAELLVLVSWMFDGLCQQRKQESGLYALKTSLKHVVPVVLALPWSLLLLLTT